MNDKKKTSGRPKTRSAHKDPVVREVKVSEVTTNNNENDEDKKLIIVIAVAILIIIGTIIGLLVGCQKEENNETVEENKTDDVVVPITKDDDEDTTEDTVVRTTTSSTTTSTASTTSTINTESTTSSVSDKHIASDDDLCNWVINDYENRTGQTSISAEITSKSDDAYEITLKDKDGNVVDVYTVDPVTGNSNNSADEYVNLPQTGNNSMYNWMVVSGAFILVICGCFAVKSSGFIRRKVDED